MSNTETSYIRELLPEMFCDEHRQLLEALQSDGLTPIAQAHLENILVTALNECQDCMAIAEQGQPEDPARIEQLFSRLEGELADRILLDILSPAELRDRVPIGREEIRRRVLCLATEKLAIISLAGTGTDEAGDTFWHRIYDEDAE